MQSKNAWQAKISRLLCRSCPKYSMKQKTAGAYQIKLHIIPNSPRMTLGKILLHQHHQRRLGISAFQYSCLNQDMLAPVPGFWNHFSIRLSTFNVSINMDGQNSWGCGQSIIRLENQLNRGVWLGWGGGSVRGDTWLMFVPKVTISKIRVQWGFAKSWPKTALS